MSSPLRIAVLVSGGGTTLQNFIDQIADGQLAAEIVQVVGSRADAFGVERARRARLPVAVVHAKEVGPEAFSERIFEQCRQAQAELVCLAGFLHFLRIPEDFALRVINIHPALLPAFGGKGMYGHHVHDAVLEHGVKVTGCTVHFADQVYDHGPIILQRAIPVLENDTPETLAFRVFEQECIAYPEAVRLFGEKKLHVEGRRVRILGSHSAPPIERVDDEDDEEKKDDNDWGDEPE
jgi:phosphoribosylglycinamide formyltransferase-1